MASEPVAEHTLTELARRMAAFIAERYPFALAEVMAAYETASGGGEPIDAASFDTFRPVFRRTLEARLRARDVPDGVPDTTPRTPLAKRFDQADRELADACDGFLRRCAIEASLGSDERRALLRNMLLTRATDNRLKAFFTS